MKAITKHLMPRYVWFMIWYKQWFKNAEGIKGFAHQVMNALMQRTMGLAEKLKKENRSLAEAIKTERLILAKLYLHPTIEADEYDEIKNTVGKLGLWITAGIIFEAALNYFGISAVMLQQGWGWFILKAGVAIVLTGFGIYIFKRWFSVALNKPMYKQTQTKPRNWIDFVLLTVLCTGYESLIYYLCRIRGIALEGANGDSFFTYFVVLAGMMLPLIAGYLAYERSLYVSPYKNTLRIAKAEKQLAAMESKIATNKQRMEDHFKREVQDSWAVMQEFKVYKENYNIKHSIKEETITGHYCETHGSFEREAIQRYKKEVLHPEALHPTLIVAKEQRNGHVNELPQYTFNNR
jgi:hypothetical protein